jgi:hypothetical protein
MVHSIPKGSTEYKAVARDQRPHLNGELASDFVGCNCRITRDVKPSPLSATVRRPAPFARLRKARTSDAKCVAPESTHPAVVLAAVKDAARR